jgi:hypothetical protein
MALLTDSLLQVIGAVAVFGVVVVVLLLVATLVVAYWMFRDRRVIMFIYSKVSATLLAVLLFSLDLMYFPAKKIVAWLNGNEFMVDIVATECRNILLRKQFMAVPYNQRVVIVPQCLRGAACPARFSSVEGAKCMGCGACKIKDITAKAKELGYLGTYIAAGGGFVRRILQSVKPRAVIGLGCPLEVNMGLTEITGKGLIGQGVMLLKSGCVETDVDLGAVYETMELHYASA